MNAINRHFATRSRLGALALVAGLATGSGQALAAPPTDTELGDCLAKAEHYFHTQAADYVVRNADSFRMATGRQVLALDLALLGGINPRFYCVIDATGRIAAVRTTPRLPGHAETLLVAK